MDFQGKMECRLRQQGRRAGFQARARRLFLWLGAGLLAVAGLLFVTRPSAAGAPPTLSENQVKALFLLNFAKYVEWPSNAFASPDSPMTIGVVGDNDISEDLRHVMSGKTFGRHPIVFRRVQRAEDCAKCHILFIRASEKPRLGEILQKVRNSPVLSVGESEQFVKQGGIINFMKKDGKVRLEIELGAARQSNLQISSKLLNVADVVHGKS